jgi:hypothetical protein
MPEQSCPVFGDAATEKIGNGSELFPKPIISDSHR